VSAERVLAYGCFLQQIGELPAACVHSSVSNESRAVLLHVSAYVGIGCVHAWVYIVLSICASMCEHPHLCIVLYKENMDVHVYSLLYIIATSQHGTQSVEAEPLHRLAARHPVWPFFYFAKLTRSNCAAKWTVQMETTSCTTKKFENRSSIAESV
jgi:hypothetical protein